MLRTHIVALVLCWSSYETRFVTIGALKGYYHLCFVSKRVLCRDRPLEMTVLFGAALFVPHFRSVQSFLVVLPAYRAGHLFFMSLYSLSKSRAAISQDTCSPDPTTQLVALNSLHMKDITQRHSRISLIYPKKRPSPHGITKLHKSPVLPHYGPARASRSPRSTKMALMQQRQREAQIIALRREGIWLEEEYRDEIHYYMQDMEVSFVAIAVS